MLDERIQMFSSYNFHMGIAEKMKTYLTTFSQAPDSEFKYFITPLFKFCPCDFVSPSLEK